MPREELFGLRAAGREFFLKKLLNHNGVKTTSISTKPPLKICSSLPVSPAPEMAVVEELSPTPGPLDSLVAISFPSFPVDFKSSFDEAF